MVDFEEEIIERKDVELHCRSIVRRVLRISARVLFAEEVTELQEIVEKLRCFEFPQMDICYKFNNGGTIILLRKTLWHYDRKNKHVLISREFVSNPRFIYEILAKLIPGSSPEILRFRFPENLLDEIVEEEKVILQHSDQMPVSCIFSDYRAVEKYISVLELCRISNETSDKSKKEYAPISFPYQCRRRMNANSSINLGRSEPQPPKVFLGKTSSRLKSPTDLIEEIRQVSSRVLDKGFLGKRLTQLNLSEILISPNAQIPKLNQEESPKLERFSELTREMEDALKMLGDAAELCVNSLFETHVKQIFADPDGRIKYQRETCWVSGAKKRFSGDNASVGLIDDSLGYDFSFYAPESLFDPSSRDDSRLISWKVEVKGITRSSEVVRFQISRNELECAKRYGSQYILLIVSLKPSPEVVIVLQNPHLLYEQGLLQLHPQYYNLVLKPSMK